MQEDDLKIYNRLLDIIVEQTNVDRGELDLDSDIDELGITGMDADELLAAIQKEFGIDFSAFEFSKYCGPESMFDFSYSSRSRLLVVDLFNAAKTKVWVDPPNRERIPQTGFGKILGWVQFIIFLAVIGAFLSFLKAL